MLVVYTLLIYLAFGSCVTGQIERYERYQKEEYIHLSGDIKSIKLLAQKIGLPNDITDIFEKMKRLPNDIKFLFKVIIPEENNPDLIKNYAEAMVLYVTRREIYNGETTLSKGHFQICLSIDAIYAIIPLVQVKGSMVSDFIEVKEVAVTSNSLDSLNFNIKLSLKINLWWFRFNSLALEIAGFMKIVGNKIQYNISIHSLWSHMGLMKYLIDPLLMMSTSIVHYLYPEVDSPFSNFNIYGHENMVCFLKNSF